jgi:hypothetical protein
VLLRCFLSGHVSGLGRWLANGGAALEGANTFSLYEIKRSRAVGQTAGAPYAPQLGTASAELSTVLAAQRSGSARATSSGPTTVTVLQQLFILLASARHQLHQNRQCHSSLVD